MADTGTATTMDEIVIEVKSVSEKSQDGVDSLIAKLKDLKTQLENVVKTSDNFSKLKKNIANANKGYKTTKIKEDISPKNTKLQTRLNEYGSLRSQLESLELNNLFKDLDSKSVLSVDNLNSSFAKLLGTTKNVNGEIARYKTNNDEIVTVMRRVKDGTDAYKVSLRQLTKEQEKSTNLFDLMKSGVVGTATKIGIAIATVKNLTSAIGGFIVQASAYEESLNLFTVTLGEYAKEALEWVNKFSNALYLDPSNVMQYMGAFNSLIKGLGIGAENSYLMSKNLTQLTYDLASFKNLDFETAFLKLQSGISGEIEPLILVAIICEYYRKRSELTRVGCDNFCYC